jgi:hypothetical protein
MLTKEQVLEAAKQGLADVGATDDMEAEHFAAMLMRVRALEPVPEVQLEELIGVFGVVRPPAEKEAELRAILEHGFKPPPPKP